MHNAISLLAFDFGTQFIGVATGQSITQTASPLSALKAKDGQPNWEQVGELLKQWQPQLLLVGLPLNMDGSASELSRRARRFAGRLQGLFGIQVQLIDERLTTREAREQLGHRYRGVKDSKVDGVAAALLIESYFNDGPGELL